MVDPLNRRWDHRSPVGKTHHSFRWGPHTIEIPMDWYWREIHDWELESMRAEILLKAPLTSEEHVYASW
jgi:hypothetical protein